MTGLTRLQAAQVAAQFLPGRTKHMGDFYDTFAAVDASGRIWKFSKDSSIRCEKKVQGRKETAEKDHAVELVTPICTYQDIETLQELLRRLRKAGAFVNSSCGVHIHVDAAPFTAQKLQNLVNIVAAKEDMVYRALQVDARREMHYCQKIDPRFLAEINSKKPQTMEQLKDIWYNGEDGSHEHYHDSRYHCLNLHSVFQKGTIEFRAFNGEIHAGKIKAYIQFCLAITAQAYNQRYASPLRTVSDNEKYTFRVWLLRLGLIGPEFKTARLHLLKHLEGNMTWRDPAQAQQQRARLQTQRAQQQSFSRPASDMDQAMSM